MELSLESKQTNYLPGARCTVALRWNDHSQVEKIELRLFWYTAGKGDRDSALIATEVLEHVGYSGEREIDFQLPRSPYSFSGRLISLLWAVEAVVPGGEVARSEFVMAPEGKEVRLD